MAPATNRPVREAGLEAGWLTAMVLVMSPGSGAPQAQCSESPETGLPQTGQVVMEVYHLTRKFSTAEK